MGNVVNGEHRTVVLSRPLQGQSSMHYSFDAQADKLEFISAKGATLTFGYHAAHDAGVLAFVGVGESTCICRAGTQGTIAGRGFPNPSPCAAEPRADLLKQNNPTCHVDTYVGGLKCCIHGQYLLDADQEPPEEYQEYRLKFRFYFEDYVPGPKPSHLNLVRFYYQTEANAGEYD